MALSLLTSISSNVGRKQPVFVPAGPFTIKVLGATTLPSGQTNNTDITPAVGNYYTFTSTSGTNSIQFTNPLPTTRIQVLSVGGGGSGSAGGGGGGGVVDQTFNIGIQNDTLTIVVGAGGTAQPVNNFPAGAVSNNQYTSDYLITIKGKNTTGTFSANTSNNIISYGGGAGATRFYSGTTGGSSGGSRQSSTGGSATYSDTANTANNNIAYIGSKVNSAGGGGGGGGNGSATLTNGSDRGTTYGKDGGIGYQSNITGTNVYYAGGGGGGNDGGVNNAFSIGGLGGGGNANIANGTPGTNGLGGGGGGSNNFGGSGSNGGSGVFIVKFIQI